jgi:poly-gamma-glutamate capsule biosynthesis protein CapA/YwtB (metallophosphatase superfamily)
MAFTGDILIHEQLWETAAAHATGSDRFDFRPLVAQVRPVIAGADLAICHLETPLSPDDRDLSSYPVFETPSEVAEAIAWAGYGGCSTASNHSLDGGASGVVATLRWLDRAGLGHAGTARTWKESRALTSYRVNGATVAHLSYSWGFNGFTPDHGWRANQIVVARVEADAARARRAGADLVVVSLHWGAEYSHTPTPWQREVADLLTRGRDIDLVVGHHAHVVQPLHRERGTWVAYGLGNFLSGMTSSLGTSAVEDGVILVVKAERRHGVWRVSDVHVVPTWVEYSTWRILPIARTLARHWPSTSLRAALRASFARTVTAVRLLGDDVRPTQSLVG